MTALSSLPARVAPESDPELTPMVAELELYALDVRALHAQRTALVEEVRRLERQLAGAQAAPARLRARLEQEFERNQALAARLQRRPPPPVLNRAARRRRTGASVALLTAVLVLAAAVALALLFGVSRAAGSNQPRASASAPTEAPAGGAPIKAAPIVASSEPALPPTAPAPPAPTPGAPTSAPAAAPASPVTTLAPAVPPRCAADLAIPALAPGVAYVTLANQSRAGRVTVLWPGVSGRIALAAAGALPTAARTPAIVPLSQLPPALSRRASAGPQLTASAPAGNLFVVLSNDGPARLPKSRALLFYADSTGRCA